MSKKDYKKGISDAMEAYEAFSEKQEAATRHVAKQVDKVAGTVDKLGDKIGEITDYITDQEKAELYRLNTPVDIADLGNQEKKMLLAILYQLAADESEATKEQQNYIRAVQKYLIIFNPQTEIDLEIVENIEDVAAQKAILQAVLEFFYLGTHPKSYTEDQLDFLECFQLNRKTRKEIMNYIEAMAEAVGRDGIAEKYGFVPQDDAMKDRSYGDNGPVSSEVADWCIENAYDLIETKDYYCRIETHNEPATFTIIHKKSGEIRTVPFDQDWKISFHFVPSRNCAIQENHIYFPVSKRNKEIISTKWVDVDTASASWMFLEGEFSLTSFDWNWDRAKKITVSDGILVWNGTSYWFDLMRDGRMYKMLLPFICISSIACEGRILMIGEHQDTEEVWLYWHDPVKNQTYKAMKSPLCASGADNLLGYYDEDATAEIIAAQRVGDHLALIFNHYDGSDDRRILCKYSLDGNTGSLEIICEGDIDEDMEFCTTLLTETETETGMRICALQNIVKHEISDDDDRDAEYFDCTTMEKIDIKEAEDIRIYGDYLFKRDGKTWCKTNIHSNQRWEML